MWKKLKLLIILMILVGCKPLDVQSTPPPGWRIPVSDLFIEVSAFPKNWSVDFSTPEDKQDDPTINHVGREWGGPGSGRAWQNIWRAYTISDAEELYDELRGSQFAPNSTLEPYIAFEAFSPPDQIGFTSETADEYYFACGVWRFPYCELVARYRNYVTNVHLPLESEIESDGGFTYEQIEIILRGMDQQFVDFFKSIGK